MPPRYRIARAYRRRDERLVDSFRQLRKIVDWYDKKGRRLLQPEPEWLADAREVLTRKVPI
jgi:hypothetical protein